LGILTSVKFSQNANVFVLKLVIESGSATEVKPLQKLNAATPIVDTEEGIAIEVKLEQK
jgi:hypothetical protein